MHSDIMDTSGCESRLTPEQVESLADEIATFAARVDVAKHALLTRLRVFDRCEAWGGLGFSSCAAWLAWRIGVGLKAAREQVRVARALGSLEKLDDLFGRGELSYSKVRAITRVATPQTEQDLIDLAMHATAAQVERLVRSYRNAVEQVDASPGTKQWAVDERFVRRSEVAGGMVRIEIQLPPEEAALVWDAVMSASSGCSLAEASAEASEAATDEEPVQAHGSPMPEASAEALASDLRGPEQRHADAIVDVARAYLQHRPRTLGSGYELVLVTSKDHLEQDPDTPSGVGGFLRDGTPIGVGVARMLACCGSKVAVTVGEHGEVLDVGRRTRVIPSAIGRALWLRDHGCRVPGCERRWHLHAHHLHEWADGGPTKLSNLVLVCPAHHRMIHEGVLDVELREGQPRFIPASTKRELVEVPASAATGAELDELEEWLGDEGINLGPEVNTPRWDGTPMRLGETLDWMLMAQSDQSSPPRSLARVDARE
ncbi:hypothetical protein ENSA5_46690 [Enhygromyxa salina]|uniref:HNH nuclease domain-containing protein n=1 Tax=Enhygromyxa salina TaxID=215803 RepID=A0A2S9XJ23_9BACT|nr:HNH endonuclease signature motif containing protein [Enhygromyxa salina]PRP92837.1 hypothetical protein ENSA5_46690 [Enhygromyxa salina]